MLDAVGDWADVVNIDGVAVGAGVAWVWTQFGHRVPVADAAMCYGRYACSS
jgi:hypothetical protein